MIYSTEILEQTTLYYLPTISKISRAIYLIILFSVIVTFAATPFIYTTISIRSSGIVRPINERVEMKAIVGGLIDSIYHKDGDSIHGGEVLLRIKDLSSKAKLRTSESEINHKKILIQDLVYLTTHNNLLENDILQLISPIYKEQLSRFIHQKGSQEASLRKSNEELSINKKLALDKVISPKELFDSKNNDEKIWSSFNAFLREQQISWQQDLNRYRMELSLHQQDLDLIYSEASNNFIKAPITGIVQGLSSKYAGGYLQANESFCNISPNDELIGECYVQTKDIGLLQIGQALQYQIEAFDYNYFGFLTGKVLAIDNDYTIANNIPVFKVKCGFDNNTLHLKNGFKGQLKKGLRFQARFIVANRNLWQLLFDKLDDWLNPIKPIESSAKSA